MRFESLCLKTTCLPGKYWEEVFLQDMTPSLQDAVRRFRPQGIIQVMDVAQWLDESEKIKYLERVFSTITKSYCLEDSKIA